MCVCCGAEAENNPDLDGDVYLDIFLYVYVLHTCGVCVQRDLPEAGFYFVGRIWHQRQSHHITHLTWLAPSGLFYVQLISFQGSILGFCLTEAGFPAAKCCSEWIV